jgi:hypothetical protein
MATPLVDYLVEVDTNPAAAVAFKKNPKAAMAAAGLSSKHQAILQSRDPQRIARAVFEEKPSALAICPIIRNFVSL